MRKAIFWITISCGITAAVLMFKRGVPPGQIAQDVLEHPIGTLGHELTA